MQKVKECSSSDAMQTMQFMHFYRWSWTALREANLGKADIIQSYQESTAYRFKTGDKDMMSFVQSKKISSWKLCDMCKDAVSWFHYRYRLFCFYRLVILQDLTSGALGGVWVSGSGCRRAWLGTLAWAHHVHSNIMLLYRSRMNFIWCMYCAVLTYSRQRSQRAQTRWWCDCSDVQNISVYWRGALNPYPKRP